MVSLKEKKGKFMINLPQYKLFTLFNNINKDKDISLKKVRKICAQNNIILKKCTESFILNEEEAIGVINDGFVTDSLILYKTFFLCYTSKPYVAEYKAFDHIKNNKFKGRYSIINLSKEEKRNIKVLLNTSKTFIEDIKMFPVETGTFKININSFQLDRIFTALADKEINSFKELELLLNNGVKVRELANNYIYNDERALGVITDGVLSDSLLIFNDFFLCYTSKPYVAEYKSLKYIKNNKFNGPYTFIRLTKKEKNSIKRLIKTSEPPKTIKTNIYKFNTMETEKGEIKIDIKRYNFNDLFTYMSKYKIKSYKNLSDLCLNLGIILKEPSKDFIYQDKKLMGIINNGITKDSLLIFDDLFLYFSSKPYIAKYNEIKYIGNNIFEGKYNRIQFSREESNKIKSEIIKSEDNVNKKYRLLYLGGIPKIKKSNVNLYTSKIGIHIYSKYNSCVLKWSRITNIVNKNIREGDSSTKTSATTAGLITGNKTLLLAGLLSSGQKEKELLKIDYKNKNGSKCEVIFETKKALELSLYLKEQRSLLYKPSKEDIVSNNKPNNNYIEQIKKLAELKEQGIISEEEFERKKKELLSRI